MVDEPMLTILGATGYTGRLCVHEAIRLGMPVRLAGRRREALEELAADCAEAGVPVRVAVADVTDPDALREVAADSDVLLSTVGPYNELGHEPVEAALDAGCAYVDVTGEVEFLTWVHRQSPRAVERGVTLAPGVGFDGVPGDLLAALAAQALDRPVARARVAYAVQDGRVSAGTARTALEGLRRGGAVWRSGRVAQEPVGIDHWHVPFPQPPGPETAVSAPLPEVVTVGRSVGAEVVRSYFVVPAGRVVASVAVPAQRLTSLLSATPVWGLLERAVDRMPAGPDAEQRRRTATVVLAEVASADGVSVVRWARLSDLYETTARIALSAVRRLRDGAGQPGVVTPSQLFDPAGLLTEIGAEIGPEASQPTAAG
ncbi:MAG TPA: saccharopine dehydrogenase NADP-binding domain-containing protein [Egibacteraceae bacterium]|nr:saccharopine dehydrogenase NADP-binding domain-containing protein [Egibacteraceae bacterium]